jgi:hypothetical protein
MQKIHEGRTYESPTGQRWEKVCPCEGATATIGAIRLDIRPGERLVVTEASLIPGPSCDTCQTPWAYVGAVSRPLALDDSVT